MTVKEKMVYFVEKFGKKKADLVAELGVAASNFRGASLQNGINSDTIEKFLTLYPQCSAEWLLRGDGSMLCQKDSSISTNNTGDNAVVIGVSNNTATNVSEDSKCDVCALLAAKNEVIQTKDDLIQAKQGIIDAQTVIISTLKGSI